MIQFNLLPDVKKQYIKAKRTKRLIMSVSVIISLSCIGVLALLFSVQFAQEKNISDLTDDIQREISKAESVTDIDKILTIQNQLATLPGLHEERPEVSRIFSYLAGITPTEVTISGVKLDIEDSTLEINGEADSIASVNKYADTLKFATYKADGEDAGSPFTDVITQLSRNDESARYTIKFKFEPVLFDNTVNVSIAIPNTITTRSTLEQPGNGLFQQGANGGGI